MCYSPRDLARVLSGISRSTFENEYRQAVEKLFRDAAKINLSSLPDDFEIPESSRTSIDEVEFLHIPVFHRKAFDEAMKNLLTDTINAIVSTSENSFQIISTDFLDPSMAGEIVRMSVPYVKRNGYRKYFVNPTEKGVKFHNMVLYPNSTVVFFQQFRRVISNSAFKNAIESFRLQLVKMCYTAIKFLNDQKYFPPQLGFCQRREAGDAYVITGISDVFPGTSTSLTDSIVFKSTNIMNEVRTATTTSNLHIAPPLHIAPSNFANSPTSFVELADLESLPDLDF